MISLKIHKSIDIKEKVVSFWSIKMKNLVNLRHLKKQKRDSTN